MAVEAQAKNLNKARQSLREAEKKLFEADKNLNKFVDKLEDAQAFLNQQYESDTER